MNLFHRRRVSRIRNLPHQTSTGLFTWDRDELRPAWVRTDLTHFFSICVYMRPAWQWTQTGLTSFWFLPRREILVPVWARTVLMWMTTNPRPGPEISSLSAFGSAIYLFDKACNFVPKPGTKHFFPVSCKRLQKFHTGKSSYWSEFVPVSCKYPLTCNRQSRLGI